MRIREHGIHYHVIARCNGGSRLIIGDEECCSLLKYIVYYIGVHKCCLFQYVIMPSHLHMMLMTEGHGTVDQLMHDICLCYSHDYNRRHGRTGHFWRHHYRNKIIDNDCYALACMRYLDRNPVAAGLVKTPDEWRWSGYHYYANGIPCDFLTPHPSYGLLGNDDFGRRLIYKSMVGDEIIAPKDERILFESYARTSSKRYRNIVQRVTKDIYSHLHAESRIYNRKPLPIV
ncbi:MAG: transposase [bacterium]